MRNTHKLISVVAPLLLAVGTSTRAASAVATSEDAPMLARLKCRNAMQTKPLFFVDGRAVSDDSSKTMSTKDVQYIAVTCLNPVDSTLMGPLSKLPGMPLISVWTSAGPFGRVEPALHAIVEAQAALLSKTGSYSRDVVHQALPSLPSDIKMQFESTATGWEATVWFDHAWSPRCHTFGGDNTSGGVDGLTKQPVPAGKIVCRDS